MLSGATIEVTNLTKRYGDVEALRGVSFAVNEGEVFGLLGPNGAGKTSTVEILEGLRTPDGGSVSVCGLDPQTSGAEFKFVIGAALQATALPDKMRVHEALDLFGSFYPQRRGTKELLDRFGLEEKRNAFYSQLSGGQKQRLALAMALVNNPRVVFLDEPTAGLDPQVRREIYDIIEELKKEKKTILMTTHYIEEAEKLCDRVAIVDHGKVIALGTPRELKERSGAVTRITVRMAKPETNGALGSLEGVTECRTEADDYLLYSTRVPRTIVALVKHLEEKNNELVSLEISAPSLEDIFLELTGEKVARLSHVLSHTWALTVSRMRLAMRNRAFLFFSLIMPLAFLFIYAGIFGRGRVQAVPYLLAEVLALTVMGSFWGLSVQLVTFREQGILRRFRVTPVGASAMLASSLVSNYFLTLPTIAIEFFLSRSVFHMAGLGNVLSIFVLVTIGTVTFASLGLIVASVTNTMQETQIINQIIWFVFLFISGATIPFPLLPGAVQAVAVFLPATYLVSGLQRAMIDHTNLPDLGMYLASLVGCALIAFIVAAQLFRWEPESKAPRQAKLWAAAAVVPFLLLGVWETVNGDLRSHAMKNLQSIREPYSLERIEH